MQSVWARAGKNIKRNTKGETMKAQNITITIKEENEKIWKGGVLDGNLDAGDIVGFFKIDPQPKFGDARSIWVVENKPKGEKGESYGTLYFSETKNGSYKLNCRNFKIPGTKLCFPVTGFLNFDEMSKLQFADLVLDEWYLNSEYAKGREYILEDENEEDISF